MPSMDQSVIGNIKTTDATPKSVVLYALPDGVTAAFETTIVAVADDGSSASWFMLGLAKRVDGSPVKIVGSTVIPSNPKDISSFGWSVTLQSNGGNGITAALMGQLGTNINWTLKSSVTLTP